jgi:predicted DNA-binding transcriptional regulator AlpA
VFKTSPFVEKPERRALIPLSDSTVDRLEARGLFPRRRTLAPGTRRIVWVRSEIQAWIQDHGVSLAALDQAEAAAAEMAATMKKAATAKKAAAAQTAAKSQRSA